MTADPVRQIAEAVLYEGYVLWPYRRSALKNQQRFTFGGIYPGGWPEDRSEMRVEFLVESEARPEVEVTVRFLQVIRRQALDPEGRHVDEIEVAGERHLSWEEATEREWTVGELPAAVPMRIAAGSEREELPGGAALVRSWEPLEGHIALTSSRLGPRLHRVSLRVANTGAWSGEPREQTLARTLCASHAVARSSAEFVSLTDPPADLAREAERCEHDGAWPVLVGEPGDRRTMLASPIILEDYPRVAPESPGDLFDGGEIDQLLTLNILALTDDEKAEMRASDPRVRAILERTESMSSEDLMRLHGTIRDLQRLA